MFMCLCKNGKLELKIVVNIVISTNKLELMYCIIEHTILALIYDMETCLHMQIAGAALFGVLLSKYDPVTCLKLAAGLMISSLPVVVLVSAI